jgi:adenylate kinase
MNRNEKLQYQQQIEEYFEKKKVYDLFEKLLKELVVNKPTDPIDYLIKRLKTNDCRRFFITGGPGNERKEIALEVANVLNYKCISIGDSINGKFLEKNLETSRKIEKKLNTFNLVDDEIVIDLFKNEVKKLEKEGTSYIVEGFPRNRVNISILIFFIRFKQCFYNRSVCFQIM